MSHDLALRCARLALVVALGLAPALSLAVERPKGVNDRIDPSSETVALFSGVADQRLEVKVIPKDASECRVLIKNLTDRPLNVLLPEAVAAAPVLAQLGNQGFIWGNDHQANAPQNVGAGFPPNQWGNNPGNFFNNPGNNNFFNVNGNNRRGNPPLMPLFNIAPEKVAQFRLQSVCLDHGKPTPKPQMPYELRPLDTVSDKPEVAALCGMLGRGEIGQRAAQAAAWHLNSGLSWEQLKAKQRTMAMGRIREPYFGAAELAAARKAVEHVKETLKDRERQETASRESLSRR